MDKSALHDKRTGLIALCSFAWGIIAHGMALFNKYSYHDDVPWFNGVGETYGLGRWALGASGDITEFLFQSRNYSIPVFNGILTIAAVAAIVYILCKKLRIYDRYLIIALTGVMICFPAVTNIFGYVFTAPYYYIGALAGIAGAYLYYRYRNVPSFIVCTVLMAFSTGLYQSNISINLMVLLLFMLEEVYTSDEKWKDYIVLALKNVLICICFMAEYFAVNTVFLKVKGQSMYDYKGVNSFGKTDIAGYFYRVYTAYKRFIKPADFINYNGVSANMFPWNLKYLHMILVAAVLVVIFLVLRTDGIGRKTVQIGLITVISPLFAYFIYVMVAEEDAHGGMAYGEVFMFALAAFFIQRAIDRKIAVPYGKYLTGACTVIMLIMGIMFARFANVCYLKAEIMQAEAISYYDCLITRIQMTEGYTPSTPIHYVEPRSKDDSSLKGTQLFDPIYLPPYQGNSIINDFAWEDTMNMWCGFSRVEADADAVDALSGEIKAMPVYPADGSVKMFGDTLVVKFSD